MQTKMVEKVARAIAKRSGADPDAYLYPPGKTEKVIGWKLYKEHAKDAIAAAASAIPPTDAYNRYVSMKLGQALLEPVE